MAGTVVQQINLYQDEFRPQREALTAANLIKGSVVLLVLLVAYSGLISWDFYRAGSAKAEQQVRLAGLKQELERTRRAYPAVAKDLRLTQAVQEKKSQVAKKRRVLDTLTGQTFGNTQGFAQHLEALARQRTEGIWLTHLHIGQGGSRFDVNGGTLEPELVPRFLKKLSAEKVFSGTEFKYFLMQKDDTQTDHILFGLSTQNGEGGL